MKAIFTLAAYMLVQYHVAAQTFIRSELPTTLSTPWEITYSPDGDLWITESGGKVSRVNPTTGAKTVVYTAADYFAGSPLEKLQLCFQPNIGSGTLGLALHPDFTNPATSYIYFVYSYNSGTELAPATKFKVVRLTWDAANSAVTANIDLITGISTGYDHLGGRSIAVRQNGIDYLYLSVGDHGISETNSPDCYSPQSTNPNNNAQDPAFDNGKIHRYNINGTIPADNPIPGNPFYTRGHRNPQGLMYNPTFGIVYDVEHGDRSDDEVNILHKGMNYGWKFVRGYHGDNNFPGEDAFIANYTPHPQIPNDSLVEAAYSFCATNQPTDPDYLDWCTVAPSDGIYYGSNGIPQWTNSLLVVALKDGSTTDQAVYQFPLSANGEELSDPVMYFAQDHLLNGRLRDIAISPDGTKIFLINNGGATSNTDKITVYTFEPNAVSEEAVNTLQLYPNPANDVMLIKSAEPIAAVEVYNTVGQMVLSEKGQLTSVNTSLLERGIYVARLTTQSGKATLRRIVKL